MIPNDVVKTYQCVGCMQGPDPETCPKANITNKGCVNHYPGTALLGAGVIALGLPKGFCRYGKMDPTPIVIYESYDTMLDIHPTLKTKFSIPVWKHLDENGNTVVRWFSPRTNAGWSTIIMGDCRDRLPQALEITQEDIDGMD